MVTQKLTARDIAREVALRLLSVHNTAERPRPLVTDYVAFKKMIYPQYVHTAHLQAVDEKLMDVLWHIESNGKHGIARLIINLPPRYGKTLNVSILFPAFVLARNPHLHVMNTSYSATLAHTNSRHTRNLMLTDDYVMRYPMAKLADDSQKAHKFQTIKGGGLYSLGVDGSATGHGASLLIGDDLVKGRAEVESALQRDKIWTGWLNNFVTRLEPFGAIILQMTRWHVDDPVGRIMKYQSDRWDTLILPAIAEENDPLGRAVGEALWAERFSANRLNEIRRDIGEYAFVSLYQQKPTPSEGGIFKRAWFYPSPTEAPVINRTVRYWDLAMSANNSADYTVGVKIGEGVDGTFYVLDVARIQRDWADVVPFMKRVILADGVGVRQGIERKGYMSRAVGDLNKDPALRGYTIMGYDVDTDKLTRALPVAAKLASGVIKILDGVWTDVYVDEFVTFPNGTHDDQVDATAGAWVMMDSTERRPISVETTRYV